MIDRQYEYRLKAGRVLIRAILWGIGAVWFASMALNNDRGLVLYIIPLSQSGATIFYASFAGLAALFCAVDAVNVARRESLVQRIAFSADGLIVPKSSFSTEETVIPYASVVGFEQFTEPDALVVIRHSAGEFSLRLDLLPDERAYAQIVTELARRVQAARAESVGHTQEEKPPKPEEAPGVLD